MNIIPHTQWEDPKYPVTGPVPIKSKITTIPAHYTAAAVVPGDTKLYLRSIQRDYVTNRHYSIGYNFAIDKTGQVWECRGLKIKCAANVKCNDWTMAVLCLVDGSQPMNAKMVASFKELGAYIQDYFGRKMTVVGHRDIGSTACPGDGIYAQVRSGALVPGAAPTPPIPPPSTGDNVIRILGSMPDPDKPQFADQFSQEFNALFYATCDAQGRSIQLQWSGSGDDPAVLERLAVMQANFGDGPGLYGSWPLNLAGVKNNTLDAKNLPVEIIDGRKAGGWTDEDFAP